LGLLLLTLSDQGTTAISSGSAISFPYLSTFGSTGWYSFTTGTSSITLLGSTNQGLYSITWNPYYQSFAGLTGDQFVSYFTASHYPDTCGITGSTVPLGLSATSQSYFSASSSTVTLSLNVDSVIQFYVGTLSGNAVQLLAPVTYQSTNAMISFCSSFQT
jgi:hypothetical protein